MSTFPKNVERVVAAFEKAKRASERTPGRQGNVVLISPEMADEVMITGDLHGNRDNFNRILQIADLATHPRRHLILQEVCHGGPLDRSGLACMSHMMLEDVAQLIMEFPERVHFLLSNHELAELVDFPIIKGGKMLNLLFRRGLQKTYGEAAERICRAFMPFLRSLPLAVRLTTGVFISHSVPEKTDRLPFDAGVLERPFSDADLAEGGAVFRMLWGRDLRLVNATAFARQVGADVLITGHEPCPEGYRIANDRQIILDCCGPKACYLMLPTGEKLSCGEIIRRITPLDG